MTHLCLSLQEAQELKAQLAKNMKAQTATVATPPTNPASIHSADINLSPFSSEMRGSNANPRFATWPKSTDKVSVNTLFVWCFATYVRNYTMCWTEHRRHSKPYNDYSHTHSQQQAPIALRS